MKHTRIGTLILAAILLLALAGCHEQDSETQGGIGNAVVGALDPSSGSSDGSSSVSAPSDEQPSDEQPSGEVRQLTFELTPENTTYIAEGKLLFTLTGAWVAIREEELPEGGFHPYDNVVFLYDEEGNRTAYSRPVREGFSIDFVQEDGSFVDGIYMVFLEMTLENQDCRAITLDEDETKGVFYDPYLFRARNLFDLEDMAESDYTYLPVFYSNYGENYSEEDEARYEHYNEGNYRWSVRVEPGETRTITLGYLIGRHEDGVLPDPADLYAVTHLFDGRNILTAYLSLEAPEEIKGQL